MTAPPLLGRGGAVFPLVHSTDGASTPLPLFRWSRATLSMFFAVVAWRSWSATTSRSFFFYALPLRTRVSPSLLILFTAFPAIAPSISITTASIPGTMGCWKQCLKPTLCVCVCLCFNYSFYLVLWRSSACGVLSRRLREPDRRSLLLLWWTTSSS